MTTTQIGTRFSGKYKAKRLAKVIVLATSHQTRGGISSVIKAHQKGSQWEQYHCKWIETHIDKGRFLKLWYFTRGFIQYLFLLPFYDLVHIHTSEPPSAFRKCIFMAYAKLWHKKTIIHFHSFSQDTTINSKYRYLYHYLFVKADVVIVLSETWKKIVNDVFLLGDKIKVVYNPCTTEILNEKYIKKQQILYAGTVNARKGYVDLIKAFALIAKDYSEWQIIFAGNGETDKGKILAAQLGIDKQTSFLGWVNGSEKDKAFKEATIFCLPSYAEGFPMAVLDAWSYGLPVITTPVGGISDIARNGHNLLLFMPGDIQQLAEQMKKMIENVRLRNSIANESIKLSRTIFDIVTINHEIEMIYDALYRED